MPKEEERRIQASIPVSKLTYLAFKRYVREGGWTMAGWIRKEIISAARKQLEIEKERGHAGD
jgi:hypothetical protein